jgi:hypothetical protein
MMQRENPTQLEMFSSKRGDSKLSDKGKHSLFNIWGYEKIIILVMVLFTVGIFSFSLGVRQGKRTFFLFQNGAEFKSQVIKETQKETKNSPQVIKESTETREKSKTEETKSGPTKYAAGYTIQVATYRTKKSAQREAEDLKRKGLQPLILPKGDYMQLCVGNFLTKNEATITLLELKKRYQDCYIRRL